MSDNSYPHMCRMDHDQIGWSGSNERCPVCVLMDERDDLRAEVAELRKVVQMATDQLDRCGVPDDNDVMVAARAIISTPAESGVSLQEFFDETFTPEFQQEIEADHREAKASTQATPAESGEGECYPQKDLNCNAWCPVIGTEQAARRPPPPEVLVSARDDVVHADGKTRAAKAVRVAPTPQPADDGAETVELTCLSCGMGRRVRKGTMIRCNCGGGWMLTAAEYREMCGDDWEGE